MGEIAVTIRAVEAVIGAAAALAVEGLVAVAVVAGTARFEEALTEEVFDEEETEGVIEWEEEEVEVDPIEEVGADGDAEGRRGQEIGSLPTATSKTPRNSFFRVSRR
jgi:hypothetical protein